MTSKPGATTLADWLAHGSPTDTAGDVSAAYDLNIPNLHDTLGPQEWGDLDMDAVFRHCDECMSPVGGQTLYASLRADVPDSDWHQLRECAAHAFIQETPAGHRAWSALRRVAQDTSCDLIKSLVALPTPSPRLWGLLPLGLVPLICLVLFPWWPIAIAPGILSVFINAIVRSWFSGYLLVVAKPFGELAHLLVAADEIVSSGILTNQHEAKARSVLQPLGRLRRIAYFLAPGRGPFSAFFDWKDYFNIVFLADINAALIGLRHVGGHRDNLLALFTLVGRVDASLAVAVLRSKTSQWTIPVWGSTDRGLRAEALWHPLVDDPVANDLRLGYRENLLLTGDNASGKTTFAKAVGVNVVLGKALGMCFAKSWESPRYSIRTLFNRDESVQAGVSHFGAEAAATASMLRVKEPNHPFLFILDEIFRGTGTVERIGIAAAVLHTLASAGHTAIAATHDRELAAILDGEYGTQHFESTIAGGRLSFNYRLQPGVAQQRNALVLLQTAGAPASVIARAQQTIRTLDDSTHSSGDTAQDEAL